ncbi:MAG: chemotaxis protein CheA [Proteobacteria bacterium]|nr:chemotaxis protein CheA [Pseudomonadota bacterium]
MIDDVEPRLIELEQYSSETGEVDEETVNLIFRLFHSIKGSAGFLGLETIVDVTHNAETLLDLFRSGRSKLSARHTDVLCRTCDMVLALLDQVETTGGDSGMESQAGEVTRNLVEMIAREEKGGEASERGAVRAADPEEDGDGGGRPETAEVIEEALELTLTPEMVQRFIEESDEQLERVEQALLALEKSPDKIEGLEEAFRSLHSFKGNCGFMGQADLERLSHGAENVLGAIKDGRLEAGKKNIPTLLYMVDVLRGAIAEISNQGPGQVENLPMLCDMLNDMAPAPVQEPKAVRAEIKEPEALWLLREEEPEPSPAAEKESVAKTKTAPMMKSRSVFRQDIRVDLTKLDQLINLVGELVIAESMVTRNPDLAGLEMENFDKATNHLDKIVRDLQDVALSVRMIPVAGIFRKMIRLVYDLSARASKKVNLTLLGEDTEIDKTVAELIADPLVHLVRNSVDHAIETPDERLAAGKPETGQITLEARHEGGEVWISIKDDGRGLNREKILARGIERGLVPGDGQGMSDAEVYDLIFQPGFSTAEQVTDVSGRGVGMDVVKKNVEKIKGHVDVTTQPGLGTVLLLRIPLTLAIMEGMLVRVGSNQYTIPLLSIRESIRVDQRTVIRTMDGQELIKVREEILPVMRLHDLHKIKPDFEQLHEGLLVIVENRADAVALFVDEILGEQQAVIKGLSNYIGSVKGVTGCTILGDGQISLILDCGGLIKKAMAQGRSATVH